MSLHSCIPRRLEACCIVRSTSSPVVTLALLPNCAPTASRGSCVRYQWLQPRWHPGSRSRTAVPRAEAGDSLSARLAETAALDQLIDLLMSAKSSQELNKLVAENLLSFDQKFWVRLATRNDTAEPADKARLTLLANTVMHIVDGIVKATGQQLSQSGRILQEILAAAADERGEWHLPLLPEQVQRMRQAMEERAQYLDEALLSNAFAWIRKATDDGQTGMVSLIQKALQLYAARALCRGSSQEAGDRVLDQVLSQEEQLWERLIREGVEQGTISPVGFQTALRKRMEGIALNMASGSYAQRVQAEYLKELETRADAVFQQIQKS